MTVTYAVVPTPVPAADKARLPTVAPDTRTTVTGSGTEPGNAGKGNAGAGNGGKGNRKGKD